MAATPNLPPTTTTVVGSLETAAGHVVLTEIRYWDETTQRYEEMDES